MGQASSHRRSRTGSQPVGGPGRVVGGRPIVRLFLRQALYAALGQWNIASSQWIPYYILLLYRLAGHPWKWRTPLLAALFFLLQAYAEMTYASFLVLFTLLWALWYGVAALRRQQPGSLRWLALGLAAIACLVLIGLAPVLAAMIPDLQAEGDILVESEGFADVFSADLLGFLVPTMYHPSLDRWWNSSILTIPWANISTSAIRC